MRRLVLLLIPLLLAPPVRAELRGHGGPVRALATAGDLAVSGSFDQSAILWSLNEGAAVSVLRFHDGAVNAVAFLGDGRFATGGEDGRIAVWRRGADRPERVLEGHAGPVVGLAVAPDGASLASASWDGTGRVTPIAGGEARVLKGHAGNVNAIAFLPDARLASAGYDATLRIWSADDRPISVVTLPTALNALAVAPDGEIVAAGADGTVRLLRPDGTMRAEIATPGPVAALALSPDGTSIAAAGLREVTIVDRARGDVAMTLSGPGQPFWSLAFRSDGRELLTGGGDHRVRRWDMQTGKEIGPVAVAREDDGLGRFKGDPGAAVFQACIACHTLTPDGGNRAGPTLHGVFGRKIATAGGYNFSPALKQLDIVWNAETIAKLFEIGPSRYTPGTKMPDQIIGNPRDREALVRFLEKATK